MRSYAALSVLANLALSSAAALPAKRSLLSTLGVATGTNAVASGSEVAWIGTDGAYTNEFINTSGEDIEVVIWGPDASWVNVNTPLITYALTNGSKFTASFSSSSATSGAWAAIYADTSLVDGQISETWGEFTFDGTYSTFDVSREVNMDGHGMSIVGEECTSNMDTCVFTCPSGETSCEFGYELLNCATGSQTGAEYGEYDGSPSGGCLVGTTTSLKTTLS